MKSCFRFLFLLAVTILAGPALRSAAQGGVSSAGTDYWLGFMPNGSGSGNQSVFEEIYICSGTANKVTINIAGSSSKTIVMTAGQIYDYQLSNYMTYIPEVATDNAIHITSTNPITVYGYSAWGDPQGIGDSPDGFLALPLQAYGTEYYTMNFPDNGVFGQNPFMPGEFLITSPYDDNQITVTPACQTKNGDPPNRPINFTLRQGQTYLVQSAATAWGQNDLTGSLIVSSKPISVLTGHQISSVPSDECCSADNLFEMIPSVDRWGTQYFDEPMAGKTVDGDYLRLLSAENGNQINYIGPNFGLHTMFLDSGEYQDIQTNTDPLVMTSVNHKRFIVAQYSYSQGFDGDPGFSDPWMVLFTPQEQFEKEMIFRTPTPDKGAFTNYLTVICQWDSMGKITINGLPLSAFPAVGQTTFIGTNPQMGARRVFLDSKPYNYVAKGPVPFAMYQYGFSDYTGYGWPTGFAQHLISPDTLPPLAQTLDSNCGDYTIRYVEPRRMTNGFSFDDTRIAEISLITAVGDSRWPTPSFNYTLAPDPNFIPGDSVYNAVLTVNDPTQDAYAAVFAVDLAGNDTVYQYYYYAPKVSFTPAAPYNFGTILAGTDSCMSVTINNVQKAGAFNAQTARVGGFAKGGTFSVSPATLSPIDSGKSLTLNLCFHATDTGVVSLDSLYVTSECVNFAKPVMGTAVTPLIYAKDLAFGEVDSGKELCKPLTIENPGKWPLTITRQDLVNNGNFSVDPNQTFPIVIPPGGRTTINYCFHPQSWGSFNTVVTFLNENPSPFEHSIKDTALLTGIAEPAGAQLTSYLKDFTIGCNDTTLYDTVYDNLPANLSIDSVGLTGPDASLFSIINVGNPWPFTLKGDSVPPFIYLQILFNPTKNGLDLTPHTAKLQVRIGSSDAVGPEPVLTIQAQLVTPIVQLSSNAIDLGTTLINQPTPPQTFTIRNAGNAPLNVGSYNLGGADAGSFTFMPAPPFTIAPGDSQVVTVTGVNAVQGSYSATFGINASCNSVAGTVALATSSVLATAHGTNHPVTYAGGCESNIQTAGFANLNTNDADTVVGVIITGANGWIDTTDFSLTTSFQPTPVPPGDSITIPVEFLPALMTDTGVREAAIVFFVEGKKADGTYGIDTVVKELVGIGAIVSREVGIGSISANVASPLDTHSIPAGSVSIPVMVNTPIDANAPTNGSKEVYGYKFDISWKRDAFEFKGGVTPAGVNVSAASYDAATEMETRHVTFESPAPLTGVTTLATLDVESMLSKQDTTGVTISNIAWLDRDTNALCYVTDSSFNGTQVLDPVCGSATLTDFMIKGSISIDGIQPNPVGTSAQIGYSLAGARAISMNIYDELGNDVKTLIDDEPATEGAHTIQFNTDGLPSGTYYCRMTDGHFVTNRQFEIQK